MFNFFSDDYDRNILEENDPVSFHHFNDIDPRKVYQTWFQKSDLEFIKNLQIRDEL